MRLSFMEIRPPNQIWGAIVRQGACKLATFILFCCKESIIGWESVSIIYDTKPGSNIKRSPKTKKLDNAV